MINVSHLIANLDEVLGDNMFLKDIQKAENLKGSKRLFVTKYQRNRQNKNEMKIFRNFMNQV